MMNKIFFFLIIISLNNCGYESLYSKKDSSNLIFGSINLEGNKNVGRKIIPLLNLSIPKDASSKYDLELITNKKLGTVAKDNNGNISIYKTSLEVTVKLLQGKRTIKKKVFSEDFTYNNIKNNFDLLQYQIDIEKNLIDKISNEIFVFLKQNK
tara:strand:- start:2168 stop:2626 length:459 start_codon:yes stop_codon:yes gene_type:complete